VLNAEVFAEVLHFPVQLLRALAAGLVGAGSVCSLRLFEVGRRQRMQELDRARAEAQQRLNRQMAEREALQRQLFRQVVWAEEEERRHIARELHDEAGQALAALSWGLSTVEDTLSEDPERAHQQIEDLQRLTEDVGTELRQLTARLRPTVLDELGLVAALFTYADECSARFPFAMDVDVAGRRRRLPSETETTLYRTAQEAITNVVKHAQASHVSIQLAFVDHEVTLAVIDDGAGMDVDIAKQAALDGKGFGLAGIRERVQLVGGDLEIESVPGTGTRLSIRVPLSEDEARE
jgi:signal transduction histidine kinase